MATIEEELERQNKIRKDKKNCDHVGYYMGHGFEILNMSDGSMVGVSALHCSMCGAVFYPKGVVIPAPPANGSKKQIITPN